MPSPINNNWSLRKLLVSTYSHFYSKTRYDYKTRDMVKVIRIEKTDVYDGKNPGQARTKFLIRTQSTPQYYPYYTKKDSKGRSRKRQMKYRHYYQVIIQLDKLSIDVPVKLRIGSSAKWDFGHNGRVKKIKHGRNIRIMEGSNYTRGINADFWFRCMWLYHKEGILFGKNWTNGPPVHTNPHGILFLPKHAIAVIEFLINHSILK